MEQNRDGDKEKVKILIENRDIVMQEINHIHFKEDFFKPRIEIDDDINGSSSLAEYDELGATIYISSNPDIYETPYCFIRCLAHEGLHFRNDFDGVCDVNRRIPEREHRITEGAGNRNFQYHNIRFARSAAECGLFDRDYLQSWYHWIFDRLKEAWPEKYQGNYSPAITKQFARLYGYSACITPDTGRILESMRKQGIL